MDAAPFDPLVAAAIHDAKNALLAIDAQLAEAERHPASADFARMRGAVDRVAGQLAELLTLYRAQRGQLLLAIDDHDLADFLADLVAELGPPPAGIGIRLDRGPAATIGAWAFDAYLVKLALLDALRNALRHARTHVSLAFSRPAAGGICFTVADDGPGFPQAVLKGISMAASGTGTGLGLSFVRLIATQHATPDGRRGQVEFDNNPGASLRLFLP